MPCIFYCFLYDFAATARAQPLMPNLQVDIHVTVHVIPPAPALKIAYLYPKDKVD